MPRAAKITADLRRALVEGGIRVPQVAEVVDAFIQEVGGTRALARILKVEFDNARAGSIIRQRILDSILRMLSLANAQAGAAAELDGLASDDLDRELARVLTEIGGGEEEAQRGPRPPGPG